MMTLYSLFEETSRRYPHNVAATFNSGITREHTTYRELDARASKMADCIDVLCEGQEIIAIYSKQSIGLVACVLGVLKCGSCFAPVDLNWPSDMVCKFLLKLNVSLVLVEKDLLESFQNTSSQWKTNFPGEFRVELIANQDLDVSGFVLARKLVEIKGDTENKEALDLAYIMQTSGTTGEAKAVRVPHKCIVPNVTDLRDIFQITSDDVVFLASPYTFDPFIVQMFLAFAAGARIAIVPDSIKGMPSRLCHILFDEERVTILQPTPSLMYHIGQHLIRTKILNKDSSLRVLAFGGESCPTLSTLRQWRPPQSNSLIYNLYGITEVSCWASCHHIPTDELMEGSSVACHGKDVEDCIIDEVNDVPLGFPLLDTVIEVRDDSGKVVQEGMGQIYIGGTDRVCLLGNETSLATGTMRATGDWAYVKNGSIWFCGRRDRQIKRMGKRINLHCIERQITEQLLESPCSLVLEETDKRNHSSLHLFVAKELSRYDNEKLASLKYNLRNLLPVEARPDYVHVVSHLPMTAHGKVDRGALLAGVEKTSMLGNMTSTREFLECAWSEVIEVREAESARKTLTYNSSEITGKQRGNFREGNTKSVIGNDMFIACGGSSLEAIRLSDLIESFVSEQRKTPVDLSELLDVILSKSFNVLCNYVDSKLTETDKRDVLESKATPHGPLNEDSSLDSFVAAADLRVSTKELKDTTSARESHIDGANEMNTQQTGAGNENKEVIFDLDSDTVSSLQTPIPPAKRKFSSLADDTSFTDNKAARTIIRDSNLKAKSDLNEHDLFSLSEVKTSCFCSVRRGNQWTVCSFCKYSTLRSTADETLQTSVQSSCEKEASTLKEKILHQSPAPLEDGKSPGTCVVRQEMGTVDDSGEEFKFTISCQWRTCLYKCIDASPLAIFSQGTPEGEVFIGSHGHVFMCIRFSDGKVLWESKVGDRIESSAALSICGQFVIVGQPSRCTGQATKSIDEENSFVLGGDRVTRLELLADWAEKYKISGMEFDRFWNWFGCYDGKVYVFNRFTGEKLWAFQTGAAVKSSPCVDPKTGVAWVGSHDHHLYALDVTNKQCVCAVHCGGGSCFSSPCISTEPYLVFIATLTGRLLAVDPAEHTILWSQQCPKPVFASPLLTPSGIVCACVDGSVYCYDFQGLLLWQFQTRGSVFSSPTYVGVVRYSTSSDYLGNIVFGSHDKSVYCLSLKGELQWSFTTDGHVYSTPFVAELNADHLTTSRVTRHASFCDKRDAGMAVFVWSTLGTLYVLDLHSGVCLAFYSLPGEVFSSPVVVDNRLLIGCRNDYLYSLEISNRK